MKTIKLTKGKAILSIMLALVLAGGYFLLGGDAFAAGGTVTVNVANQGEWPEGTEFTFNLYKVGDYDHDAAGKAIFTLDSSLSDSGVASSLADASNYEAGTGEGADAAWSQKWLGYANTLATYMNGMEDKPASTGEKTVTFGAEGSASINYSVSENGLYLLVGNSTEVDDTLWTPQPMFISVLNGNRTVQLDNSLGVKLTSRKIVNEHSVIKLWSGDDDVKATVRPESIAVKIMYGSTPVDTVILKSSDNASANFTYSWTDKVHYSSGNDAKSQDDDTITSIDYIGTDADGEEKIINFTPAKGDAGWSVVELRGSDTEGTDAEADAPLLKFYETAYETQQMSESAETFKITNTYSCKSLKLVKTIDGYDDDGSNVTFSFKIVGKDADGNVVYTNHAGVSFTKEDGLTKETVITNIPGDVASIEVTEEYSGNYELDGEIKVTELPEKVAADSDDEDAEPETRVTGWKATANNKHGDHGPKGGIVNRYNQGKIVGADAGQAPSNDSAASGTEE